MSRVEMSRSPKCHALKCRRYRYRMTFAKRTARAYTFSRYNVLRPESFGTYFDAETGFLDFPVRVHPSKSGKYHEVRVLMAVTTSFGLKLAPDILDFGTVSTTETVVRSVRLTNRSRTAMTYGFLKLPKVNNSQGRCSVQSEKFKVFKHVPESFHIPQRVRNHIFRRAFNSPRALRSWSSRLASKRPYV